jgi:predicted pyridoxine 5'-phosphate oxidase superfamily flavin-nucleotide-binding protein
MSPAFADIAGTRSVKAAQAANGSKAYSREFKGDRRFDRFTKAEAQFIAERDSFYMATVSETGWPYVQHRGGPPGFLHLIHDRTLAFADYGGNRQYISVGNLTVDDRAALILMDYAGRRRLKMYVKVEAKGLDDDPALAEKLVVAGYRAKPERILLLHLLAFDWNCPQHITPRFTDAEIALAIEPVHLRLGELEAENAALRGQLAKLHITIPPDRAMPSPGPEE